MSATVVVAAGTGDGMALALRLADGGWDVVATQATDIPQPWPAHPRLRVRRGALDAAGWRALLSETGAAAAVDATHPFAVQVRGILRQAALDVGIRHLRLGREASSLPPECRVADPGEAVERLFHPGRTVFLATGSRTAPFYHGEALRRGCRVVARLCPGGPAEEALAAGFPASAVVWGRGLLPVESWKNLLGSVGAHALLTKESGPAGGVPEKRRACEDLGLRFLALDRPVEGVGGLDVDGVVASLRELGP